VRKTPTIGAYSTGVFHWAAVRRADHYEFELAGDPKFNSLVPGHSGHFSTDSTSATLSTTLQDGTYWWRVRAVHKNGSVTRWISHSFKKVWGTAPTLLSPADGAGITFPTQPLLLSWKPVLGAVSYEVTIGRDPNLTSLVSGAQAVTTAASYIPPSTLAEGTYYWAVTPVDAERHVGKRSAVRSFQWSWPTSTLTNLSDLVSAPEFFDPLLSWTAVPGAAGYELEVNFSQDFNVSSKVCCSSTTVATGYSPTRPLPNNTYFWRVRAVNVQGAKGVWTEGASFLQPFDTIPPLPPDLPTISGLHVRDNFGDAGPEPPGWATPTPIIVWNPVAGASAYDLDVYAERPDNVCDPQYAADHNTDVQYTTPLTAWTPLGDSPGPLPYPASGTSLEKGGSLIPGDHYCIRIRAIGETSTNGQRVYGDYTFLDNAFTYVPNPPATGPVSLPSGYYSSPIGGVTTGQTPLYIWQPIPGANSYWVIVARDPSFTTLVDYAFTQAPAFAPRRTIADETTSYYWAILPAANSDGSGLPIDPNTGRPVDPLGAAAASFQKRSTPPTLLSPLDGTQLAATQPAFQWTPVQGARNYRLEVSTDPNFGTLLDNVVTGSTGYVSTTTYPAQSTLYWRVQANDEDTTALTWSSTGTFRQVLPTPQPLAEQASPGDLAPAFRWAPVSGAIGYDVHVVLPGGSSKDFSNIPTPAMVPVALSGTGAFQWQVRADFSGGASGPYSSLMSFSRTVTPPLRESLQRKSHTLIFSWQGRPGIKNYVVQVASRPDFSGAVETDKTEGTVVASLYTSGAYAKGGKFYWRVAAVDANGNTGGFSPTKTFRLPKHRGHH
jgi:hypothetical protein